MYVTVKITVMMDPPWVSVQYRHVTCDLMWSGYIRKSIQKSVVIAYKVGPITKYHAVISWGEPL